VITATGEVTGTTGDNNICIATFAGMTLQRDEFFEALSAAFELKPQANVTFPQGHMEIYEIKSDKPAKQILELISLNNGAVIMTGVLAARGLTRRCAHSGHLMLIPSLCSRPTASYGASSMSGTMSGHLASGSIAASRLSRRSTPARSMCLAMRQVVARIQPRR
jgi:hypothetical protein